MSGRASLPRLAPVLLLVCLFSLCWLPTAVESQGIPAGVNTTLYSWCYYTASHRLNPQVWSIYASGSLVASTLMHSGPVSNGRQGFPVYYLSGTRVITLNGQTTTSIIAGIAPQGTYMANDNFLYPQWPNLGGGTSCYGAATNHTGCQGVDSAGNGQTPGGGLSFTLDGVAPLANGSLVSVVNINGDPMNEWPEYFEIPPVNRASNITGVSYFVFQAASIAGAISCQPPAAGTAADAAATYSFTYVTSPVGLSRNLFSACVKAQVKMLGPFTLPTGNGTTGTQYVLYAANGTRTYAANNTYEPGYSQTVNIIGVGGSNGGDFRLYSSGYVSPVDYPGITFDTASPPAMEFNNATLDPAVPNYCHIYYTGSFIQEADWNDIEGAVAIQYAQLRANPALDAYTCPTTVQSQSFSFCHYAQGPNGPSQWTVVTYGTLITFPEASGGFLTVTAISGSRTQTVGSTVSGPIAITGLIFPGGASNGNGDSNDNLLSVTYPFISYHGLAYNLATYVQLPPNQVGASVNQNFIKLISDPPCEVGTCTWTNSYNPNIPNTNGGVAYFLLQAASAGPYTAANCGGPSVMPTTSIGFGYTASPQFGSGNQYYLTNSSAPSSPVCTSSALVVTCPLWSSCASLSLTAIGPISYPGGTQGSTDSVYVIVNATGTRYYADVTGFTQSVQITGVSPGDGGDFNLFVAAPYVDDAGISFTTSSQPAIAYTDLRGSTSNVYFNLWSPQQNGLYAGQTAAEAIVPGYLNNVAVISWAVGAVPSSCPASYTAPTLTALSFCFYMQSVPTASNPWTVVTSGTLYGVPSTTSANSWYITGVTGTRAHYLGLPGYALTLNDTVNLTGVNLDGQSTNTLHTSWPFVDYSPSGFNFQLSAQIILPGMSTAQNNVVYSDDPPYEVGVGSTNTDTAYASYQLASAGPLSCGIQTGTSQLSFSYTVKPYPLGSTDTSYGLNWQSCAVAVLTVLGPFSFPQPSGGSVSAYQVVGAVGYRTFTSQSGVASTVAFSSLNSGVAEGGNGDGSDNRLYTTAPYVDDAGITFATNGVPQWPNSGNAAQVLSLQQQYVNLWSSGGLYNNATYATEAVISYTPNNVVSISFQPLSASSSISQCAGSTMTLTTSGQLSSTGSGSGSGSSSSDLSHGDIAAIVICTVFAVLVLMLLAACCGSAYAARRSGATEASPMKSNPRYQTQPEDQSKNGTGGNVELGTA